MSREQNISKVLELKGFTREQIEAEVRKIREHVNSEQEKFDALERTYKMTCDSFACRQKDNAMPVQEMDLFYEYLKHLTKEMERQKKVVALRQAELDKRQKAVVEAFKEERLVEILHDKIQSAEARAADRMEQKEADSAFLMRKKEK